MFKTISFGVEKIDADRIEKLQERHKRKYGGTTITQSDLLRRLIEIEYNSGDREVFCANNEDLKHIKFLQERYEKLYGEEINQSELIRELLRREHILVEKEDGHERDMKFMQRIRK
ncbi:hypothetical protein P4T70_24540 [Bacillus mobilis]|uniref:hypothetical protein n=1 Tax=Bacillus mobilis TaxID=2026190 RepID=UPI002E1DB155|nr:hypothetical protein [Bacillus mobilis]